MRLLMRGSFVHLYLQHAAEAMGIELVNIEDDNIQKHITDDTIGFLFFAMFANPKAYEAYANLNIPKIFWAIEDPNHFGTLVEQARHADIIFTTAQECIHDYQLIYPDKPVHCLTWACEPEIHYLRPDDIFFEDRDWDIVFVGNRYPREFPRVIAEDVVLRPAIEWAEEHGKRLGVWGLGDDSQHSWRHYPLVYPKYYREYTHALEAPNIYRRSIVVLAMNEQFDSPTMTSMRTYEACSTGNIVLSHGSVATSNIFGDVLLEANNPTETKEQLDWVFTEHGINQEAVLMAQRAASKMINQHTYKHRLTYMLETLAKYV